MLLLTGLGNPGDKYARHRHNVGFMAVDAIADANGFGPARKKFRSEIREGVIAGEKVIAIKPLTFMNESGQAVGEAVRFYKLAPADVVVFHDELDLAAGKIKVKCGGGNAGHNGLKSIDAHIGNAFRRVRIGIGHPGDKSRVTGHVLGDFAKSDDDWLAPLLAALAKSARYLVDGDARFATAVAQHLHPAKPKPRQAPEQTDGAVPAPSDAPKTTNIFADALKNLFPGKKNDQE
ncbi:MAG: aminoacyl-tRNA hydrolase [Parvularculaceae bacterium]